MGLFSADATEPTHGICKKAAESLSFNYKNDIQQQNVIEAEGMRFHYFSNVFPVSCHNRETSQLTMDRKIAIVTGTSRLKGIGKAICLELAKNGIEIFFTVWTDYDKQMPWKIAGYEQDLIQAEIRHLLGKSEVLGSLHQQG